MPTKEEEGRQALRESLSSRAAHVRRKQSEVEMLRDCRAIGTADYLRYRRRAMRLIGKLREKLRRHSRFAGVKVDRGPKPKCLLVMGLASVEENPLGEGCTIYVPSLHDAKAIIWRFNRWGEACDRAEKAERLRALLKELPTIVRGHCGCELGYDLKSPCFCSICQELHQIAAAIEARIREVDNG